MLTTNILLAEKYDYLSEKFKKSVYVFKRYRSCRSAGWKCTDLTGTKCMRIVQSYSTNGCCRLPFESHKDTSMYNM
mgnify:CR=1 FL=1